MSSGNSPINSSPIRCEWSVEGNGPPLILIHGIGAARNTWRFALPRLARHFTVITYDLRGHGASPLPNGEFDLDDLVADLEWVRVQSGFEKVHVAGHSLGGMIGPAYAHAYPQNVYSVGLLSTAAFRTEDDSRKVNSVVDAMQAKGVANILPTLVDRWFTDEFILKNKQLVDNRLKQVVETNEQVFMNVFRIYANTEMSPWLHEIQQACLVLTGENDGGCNPRLNKLIDGALPNSELVILPNYKHSLLLEAGDIIAGHLVRFINSIPDQIT